MYRILMEGALGTLASYKTVGRIGRHAGHWQHVWRLMPLGETSPGGVGEARACVPPLTYPASFNRSVSSGSSDRASDVRLDHDPNRSWTR